ncbi:hypothetical protein ACFV4M_04000 [Kitasatospora indigofera]|uniref:hypothetical protein n=1 Tax=Kitasatospora indigofera TaxID=67307 RepID=UPI00364F42A4
MVTNGRFSRDAVKWGAEQNVLLVDRELLGRWASSGALTGFAAGVERKRWLLDLEGGALF